MSGSPDPADPSGASGAPGASDASGPEAVARRRRVKVVVEYDGGRYRGWQLQATGPTIQGELEDALLRLTGETLRVRGAGRTDAGVHARGQVAVFDTLSTVPTDQFARALNSRLPPDIAVRHAAEVPPAFDPRHECVGKRYVYAFHAGPLRPALDGARVWHVPWPVDPWAMAAAAGVFAGRHDFKAFCRIEADAPPGGTVRDVDRCEVEVAPVAPPEGCAGGRPAWRLRLTVEGRSFLYNMVRTMAAALVEVGRGRMTRDDLAERLSPSWTGPRVPVCAPAGGLCLEWIRYPL